MLNSNSKNNPHIRSNPGSGDFSSSASSTRSIKRQMSAASHATLTVGSSRLGTSNSQSNYMNRKVGNTITVGRRNNHDLDNTQPRAGTVGAGAATNIPSPLVSKNPSSNTVPQLDKDENQYPIQLTVWFHELPASSEDIIIDSSAFPGGVQIGQVFELQASNSKKKNKKLIFIVNEHNLREHLEVTSEPNSVEMSTTTTTATTGTATTTGTSQAGSKSKFQISLLSNPLQNLLDLPARSQVQIQKINKLEDVTVELVEIFIKDVNLSRDSMWNFSALLSGTCGYIDQRLTYLNNRTGIIKYMYKNGKQVFSGYISKDTKIIFRSESAKLTVLIQLSQEMWHFEENGEIMFHKLVNNLFPKIFRRWRDKNTHHSITIVLFASVDLTDIPWTLLSEGERPPNRRDYYRVVVDQVNILYWDRIMANLRLEFANFKRDIMLNKQDEQDFYKIEGQSLPSVKGNFLEAVNVGLTLLIDRFRNTDLKHSLSHFMMITAGTGLFDVDYDLLLDTSKKITSIDTSIDIICLSQPPLHVTPLFRYLKDGKVCYCVPNWCDISFYQDKKSTTNGQWIPRCKIYELQMMGVMENEVNDARIPRFHVSNPEKSLLGVMDDYDEEIFKPISHTIPQEQPIFNTRTTDSKIEAPPPVKDSTATLSLIFNPRLLPTGSATSTSAAVGTVARPNIDVSALSTLYSINKNIEGKPISSEAPSIKSMTPDTFKKEPEVLPRIIKSDKFLKPATISTTETLSDSKTSQSLSTSIGTLEKKKMLGNRKKSSILVEPETLTNSTDLFWWEISNPSKELNNNVLLRSQVSRWSNVFPSKAQRKLIKWRSFQAPAALPITTGIFPTPRQLESEYTFQIYTVFLNYENHLELTTTYQLMKEMIQLRLMLGFQICYGDRVNRAELERKPSGSVESIIKYFPKDNSYLGSRIYMMLDDEIHRIFCDYSGNLNVQLYRRTPPNTDILDHRITLGQPKIKPYFPLIRTRYADDYTATMVDSIAVQPQKYNWNQFDQLIAGFDDAMPENNKEFHKMKFVILPTDIPKNAYFITNENLSPEEIRVEGLRKLIAVIERGTYKKNPNVVKNSKEERFPDIIFYTGNLYDFLKEEADNYDIKGTQPSLMLPENVRFNKSVKLTDLAKEMQSPTGLKLVDRTWHFKRHLDSFIGSELVSWLLECFEDIDSREEATGFGQSLMTRGLFKHVELRHGLLDGYYFYRFEDEYFEKTKKSTWFGTRETLSTKKSESEILRIPGAVNVDELPKIFKIPSRNIESESSSVVTDSGSRKQRKFILSKSIKFDVDPLRKSFRPELVTVHYDRVHNPEHCYHIRLQWLNTTTKFIEDTITGWSRLCERHGLKLIETPWKELCAVPTVSPFHSFVEVNLSLDPWLDDEFGCEDIILSSNKYYFHLYFLKKLEFLLDNRTTSFFSDENIDISYSWGKPTFKYAQFIHRTGAYIIELRTSGGFFLAPNNIHLTRINSSIHDATKLNTLDSQTVMLKFRAACQNQEFLREIFREAKESWKEQYFSPIT
ncbi:Vacuolar membrane-associated protein [Spathaspora sp. JA1]|nr:Vacuolar membrane-associated protein [Spathaspora sp. JA1]